MNRHLGRVLIAGLMIRVDWADDPFVWVTFVRSLRVWGHAVQVMKGELSL